MNLRLRINFMVAVTIGASLYCANDAMQSFSTWHDSDVKASASLDRRATVYDIAHAGFNTHSMKQLQKLRADISDKDRAVALSDFIQSYSAQERSPAADEVRDLRATNYLNLENTFYKKTRLNSGMSLEHAMRMAWIALLVPLFGLFVLLFEIRKRVFKSIDRLSRRMMDFLSDRYSFQFSEPESNELGHLQRTFNALAQRVINTMDELKNLDQAKSEFLSITSHELRTPMTSIKGSLSLLASGMMGPIDPACMKLIHVAEIETDRLIRLINDLLDLAKIEAGKLPLVATWLSWGDVGASTVDGLTGLAHKAGVSIVLLKDDPTKENAIEVFMDRDRVQQVLTNLISNAVKFSPRGTTVYIATGRTKNGEFLINVRDQGPGISSDDQELIFEKFRQGATPDNPIVKGTGLGLAICKALVEEHGGQIGVSSKIGEGSTFWFTLPKWRATESSTSQVRKQAA